MKAHADQSRETGPDWEGIRGKGIWGVQEGFRVVGSTLHCTNPQVSQDGLCYGVRYVYPLQ